MHVEQHRWFAAALHRAWIRQVEQTLQLHPVLRLHPQGHGFHETPRVETGKVARKGRGRLARGKVQHNDVARRVVCTHIDRHLRVAKVAREAEHAVRQRRQGKRLPCRTLLHMQPEKPVLIGGPRQPFSACSAKADILNVERCFLDDADRTRGKIEV